MKASTGTISLLLFTALATAAFVWMAKRPAVEGNAMVFGMPSSSTTTPEPTAPDATIEKTPRTSTSAPEATTENTEEKAKVESISSDEAPKKEAPDETKQPETTSPTKTESTTTPETTPVAEPDKTETTPKATDKPQTAVEALLKKAAEIKIPADQ